VLSLILRSLLLLFLGPPDRGPSIINSTSLIEGTYNLESSENFNAYLQELGVSYILRNLASLAKPTVTISRDCPDGIVMINATECTWNVYTDTAFKSHSIRFKLGTVVDDYTMDGRSIQTLFTLRDANTLIEHQMGKVNTTLERAFDEDKMKVTLYVNNVIASSIFPRVKAKPNPPADGQDKSADSASAEAEES